MNTFTFVASSDGHQLNLNACASLTKRRMPNRGGEIEQRETLLPGANCGWFWLRTDDVDHAQLISEAVGEQYAVLAYGKIAGSPAGSAAGVILNAWSKGEAAEVLKLNGNFGAVVVNRKERSVHLISDIIGHRTLRYYVNDSVFITSPHEVALVATGLVPTDFDYVTAASIAVIEWSVGGKGLLRHINNVQGGDHVRWRNGQVQHYPVRILDPGTRIKLDDHHAVKDNVDQLINLARDNARAAAKESPVIYADLTAGQDSRAVLGLLLAELNPDRIVALTRGTAQCQEARVAARLAKMYKVRHRIDEDATTYLKEEEFKSNVDALAFAMNGDTDAKRAATPFSHIDSSSIHVTGVGSGVFRGYYYSRSRRTETDIIRFCSREDRASRLPWSSPEYFGPVLIRIAARIREFAAQSESAYDVLDLYYLRERFGVWGAITSRTYIENRHLAPLINPPMVRLAYRMPSPIGAHAAYTQECIRRFLPRAYWLRVNGNELLPLGQCGSLSRVLSYTDRLTRRIWREVGKRFGRNDLKPNEGTPDEARSAAFAGPLCDYLRDALTVSGSVAVELFGLNGIEQLLEEHASGSRNNMPILGALVTLEHYRKMITGTAREASRHTTGVQYFTS
jgi:hypothetical protein